MFSMMNLALLAAGGLLLMLLMKLRRDKAANGGAPKASKKPSSRNAPKAGRRFSAPKRGAGRPSTGGRGRGRGRGRQPEPVAMELPPEQAYQPHHDAPAAVASYPVDPSMMPAPAVPAAYMPDAAAMPQVGAAWSAPAPVAQPGWPTGPEQPQWGTPGGDGLGYAAASPAYPNPGVTGAFPTVGGPLSDPGAAAAMVTNGNGAFPGVPTTPPMEWSAPAADANAAWQAPAAPAPRDGGPPSYADVSPAPAQEWASWAPQGDGSLGSPVPDAVPEQWSQPAPEAPEYESSLPALDAHWEQSSGAGPAEAMPAVLADAHHASSPHAQEWGQPSPVAPAQGGVTQAEVIYDDFGFPIEDAATIAPTAPMPAAAAPSYDIPAAQTPHAAEVSWELPPSQPAPSASVAPVETGPRPNHVEIPVVDIASVSPTPVEQAAQWTPVETRPVEAISSLPVVEILPDAAPVSPHLAVTDVPVVDIEAPAISMVGLESAPNLATTPSATDEAWWDDRPPVVVATQSQQTGRFALGGHAIRAAQEALTGVTFREPLVDEQWVIATDAQRAARIELTIEGAVNCASGGVEVVADPGFAPTEDGFTVRLVAENAGPFMASGRYRVL